MSATSHLANSEAEAKLKARQQIANLLQRPDQLDKVEQIKKRISRKKTTVEGMLKTAVQSQLDGVRTGLLQLHIAVDDIKDIKNGLIEIDETYMSIENLADKLKKIREENSKHTQLATALNNLKHVFNVPEIVKKIDDSITNGKLLYAHSALTELEMARDNLLFELHRQANQSTTDKNIVMHYFGDVDKLNTSLAKHMWVHLQRCLVTLRREPNVIVTVLRIIEREEKMDAVLNKRKDQTGFIPPGRPREWHKKCFEVLNEAVELKIECNQMEDRDQDKMWLVRHLEITRQIVLEDLRVIKTLCEPCFPPTYNIVDRYIDMYHDGISSHLSDIIDKGLEGNEIISLLLWEKDYFTKELMGHPELKIDSSRLKPLLSTSVVNELQNQYIQKLRSNLQGWMKNSLKSDVGDWWQDNEPDSNDKGFFNTTLPSILFQMIEQNIHVAATINSELVMNCLDMVCDELAKFVSNYKQEILNFKETHFSDRSIPQFFLHYMIANTNNTLIFSELVTELPKKYRKGDIDDVVETDGFVSIESSFLSLSNDCCSILVDEMFLDLDPQFQQLFTLSWKQDSNTVDTICITVEDYCTDFVHLTYANFDKLILKTVKRVFFYYAKALFAKRIVFKSYEERLPAAEKMCTEALQITDLMSRLSPNFPRENPFDSVPMLAEVIKLKDTSMMSLELSNLANRYPDIKVDQLVNLLGLRGDVNRSDARQMVLESIGEDSSRTQGQHLFSKIPC